MRIFVTGASGWVGSAVVPELVEAGHEVLGLARSETSAGKIAAAGGKPVRGDLGELGVLQATAAACDGVIHLAFVHDFSRLADSIATDRRVIEALGVELEGSGKPFVVTSGTPTHPGRMAIEGDRGTAESPMAGREANAELALAMAERGVRSCVVRLPRVVHGDGDRHGLVPRLIRVARENELSGYVGDGSARWPAVHVRDAGRLYVRAVEQAPAGSVLHAVADQGIPTLEIAEALGAGLGLPVAARPAADFGFLGPILSVDQPASSEYTGELLGWQPVEPGLIEDLGKEHYFG